MEYSRILNDLNVSDYVVRLVNNKRLFVYTWKCTFFRGEKTVIQTEVRCISLSVLGNMSYLFYASDFYHFT